MQVPLLSPYIKAQNSSNSGGDVVSTQGRSTIIHIMRHGATCFFLVLTAVMQLTFSSKCKIEFVPHEIFYEGGVRTLTIDGARDITVTAYSVFCSTFYYTPTGLNYEGSTALSMNVSLRTDTQTCSTTFFGDLATFHGFQAIVVRTPGWSIQPRDFRVKDLDAHADTIASWKEVAGVFGMYKGEVVSPSITVDADTVLAISEGHINAENLATLELVAAEVTFPAIRYAAQGHQDCQLSGTTRCDMTVDFESPIDTFVLLISTFDKKLDKTYPKPGNMSGILTGPIVSECGCRCALKDLGKRSVHVPAGSPGECKKKESDRPVVHCDEYGPNWCAKRSVTGWVPSGGQAPSGNVLCSPVDRFYANYLNAYDP